jgi:flagellar hook-length control protein FliK
MASVSNIFLSLSEPSTQSAGANPVGSSQQPNGLFASLLAAIGQHTGTADPSQSETTANNFDQHAGAAKSPQTAVLSGGEPNTGGGSTVGTAAVGSTVPPSKTAATPTQQIATTLANQPSVVGPDSSTTPTLPLATEGLEGKLVEHSGQTPGQTLIDGQANALTGGLQTGLDETSKLAGRQRPLIAGQVAATPLPTATQQQTSSNVAPALNVIAEPTPPAAIATASATASDATVANTIIAKHPSPTAQQSADGSTGLDRAQERASDAGRLGLDVARRAQTRIAGAAPALGETRGSTDPAIAQTIRPNHAGQALQAAAGTNAEQSNAPGATTAEQSTSSQYSLANAKSTAHALGQNVVNPSTRESNLAGSVAGDIEPLGTLGRDIASQNINFRGLVSPVASQPQAPQLPLNSLAVHIAQQAQAGAKRFDIRLDPPELGRLDIRLDVARDGRTTTHLVVERAETLDLLQRDARSLERALQNAGLDTSKDGLTFSLKDQQSSGSGNRQSDGNNFDKVAGQDNGAEARDDDSALSGDLETQYQNYIASDRVDIRI